MADRAAPPASDFRRVLVAEGVSNFGSMLSRLAIPWLAALWLQATPMQMAALVVADVVAAALSSLLFAGMIDRSGKRTVMLGCDLLRFALLAVLALASWLDELPFALLLLAAMASGMLTAGFELARSAWIAQAVNTADLPRRNAQLSAVSGVSEAAAFALGGWLYQGLGAALALAIDAASYALSALALRNVQSVAAAPQSHGAKASRNAWLDDCTSGLRMVARHKALRALATIELLLALGSSLSATSYMIYVARDLAMPTGLQGMIFAVGALGTLAGAALAPTLGRGLGSGRAMSCGLAALAAAAVLVPAATSAAWAPVLLLVQQVLGDAGHTVHDVHDRTLRQTIAGADSLARVDAAIRSIGHLATLAGAAIGGLLGTTMTARPVLALAAVVFALAALCAAMTLARRQVAPAPVTN